MSGSRRGRGEGEAKGRRRGGEGEAKGRRRGGEGEAKGRRREGGEEENGRGSRSRERRQELIRQTGCWKETPLLQLPHFSEYSASNASARRFQAHDVIAFKSLPQDKKKEFYEKEEFKPEQIKDIEDVLEFLPTKVACEYRYVVCMRGGLEKKRLRGKVERIKIRKETGRVWK